MSNIKINPGILKGLAENCAGDEVLEKFLVSVVLEEAERPGQWRWKDVYRRLVADSSAVWEAGDEI